MQPQTTQFLSDVLRGDQGAVSFCQRLLDIAETWDNLVDRDNPITDGQINKAFDDALIMLPAHPFYQQHLQHLHPVISNAILNWRIATALERSGSTDDRAIAYSLRGSIADVVVNCVLLVTNSIEQAIAAGQDIRRFVHQAGYVAFEDELGNEHWRQE